MNSHNIKLTFRSLGRNKLYSILSILGFSVGFAVSILIAMYVYSEFTVDHCYPDYKRIVRVIDYKNKDANLDCVLSESFKEKFPGVELACPAEIENGWDVKIKSDYSFTKFQGLIITSNDFFKLFPLKVLQQTAKNPITDLNSAVLTRSLADVLFPGENPLGKSLLLMQEFNVTVSAVVEDFPANSSIQAKLFLNIANVKIRMSQVCNNGICMNPSNHFLLLRKGTNLQVMQVTMNRVLRQNHPEIGVFGLQRLEDIYLGVPMNGSCLTIGNPSMLDIFISIGLVVLILSIINFLNFYFSMQYSKLREIGIKKINGASYGQLVTYSLVEVTVSILLSLVFSLFLVAAFMPATNQLFGKQFGMSTLLNPLLAAIIAAIVILSILVTCIAPVVILSRFRKRSFLGALQHNSGKQIGSRILTLVQFSASIILITVVLSLNRQISYTRNANLGFQKENLMRLNLPYKFKGIDAMKQQLEQLSFCKDICMSSGVPGDIFMTMGEFVNNHQIMLKTLSVDNDFLKTMGVQMKSGHWFQEGDIDNSCIVNEEAMRQYGRTDFTGQCFHNGKEGGYAIVGVVKDFHVESLHSKIEPVCLISRNLRTEYNAIQVTIRLEPGETGQKMKQLEKVWKSLIPDEPIDFTFYDEHFNSMYQRDEQLGHNLGIVAFIALVLTFMGILGQSFQLSLNRTKEIGIRKVNGASVFGILFALNREFLGWLMAAFVLAAPVSYYFIHKWLDNFAYKADISWVLFVLAGVIVFVTVIFTVCMQSWRTATRNPVDSLRYE
ncbi:MAG: ABC transporter permease [Bacteroidetes bacterium]|nr:ABC transporter permease [Bacteroidota bacterium]